MKFNRLVIFLIVIISSTMLFGLAGCGTGSYDTEFPLPSNVEIFTKFDDDSINYQTSLSLNELVEFYRDEFADAGYDERDINTEINDAIISIVWDGHTSGNAIVVQGVDLGDGKVNVNVRFEDI
ncbi:MAG: hypothetical protein QGM50_00250 [Anaerolineae bacterium]|nr:hypothetical protein [Anaerolineae bacterium]MDK1117196.1 hypothetical protein [Anaerolineae bacterium]